MEKKKYCIVNESTNIKLKSFDDFNDAHEYAVLLFKESKKGVYLILDDKEIVVAKVGLLLG